MNYDKINQINFDMDGVLTDWIYTFERVAGIKHDELSMLSRKEQLEHVEKMACEYSRHYTELPPIWSNLDCFKRLMKHRPDLSYKILTSVGKHNIEHLIEQKKYWIGLFWPEFDIDNMLFPIRSKDKAYYAKPGVVLIDDFQMVRDLFVQHGGMAVDGSNLESVRLFCDGLIKAKQAA